MKRTWKKDGLHVSLQCLMSCFLSYQEAVKAAKTDFMLNLVSSNDHRPQVLFHEFNRFVNPSVKSGLVPSRSLCN